MKFRIDEQIFEDFDKPLIGVIVCREINNIGNDSEIDKLLRTEEANLRKKFNGVEISEHPNIAPWRQAYRKFGSKPRDYRCSGEALARIVLRGSEIRNINKLVDLYNYISIKYTLPVGAEDLDKMKGDLVLGFADGTEDYTPLGKDDQDPPKKGEVIYRDDIGVICRRWNWREGDRTKITNETKNAIVVIESLAPIPEDLAKDALNELVELLKKYCGGEITTYFLDKETKEVDF